MVACVILSACDGNALAGKLNFMTNSPKADLQASLIESMGKQNKAAHSEHGRCRATALRRLPGTAARPKFGEDIIKFDLIVMGSQSYGPQFVVLLAQGILAGRSSRESAALRRAPLLFVCLMTPSLPPCLAPRKY